MDETIKYICLPLGLKAIKQDLEIIKMFNSAHALFDLIEPVQEQMQKDFYAMIGTMYNRVTRVDAHTYIVDKKKKSFTGEELKKHTSDLVKYYMASVGVKKKERMMSDYDIDDILEGMEFD